MTNFWRHLNLHTVVSWLKSITSSSFHQNRGSDSTWRSLNNTKSQKWSKIPYQNRSFWEILRITLLFRGSEAWSEAWSCQLTGRLLFWFWSSLWCFESDLHPWRYYTTRHLIASMPGNGCCGMRSRGSGRLASSMLQHGYPEMCWLFGSESLGWSSCSCWGKLKPFHASQSLDARFCGAHLWGDEKMRGIPLLSNLIVLLCFVCTFCRFQNLFMFHLWRWQGLVIRFLAFSIHSLEECSTGSTWYEIILHSNPQVLVSCCGRFNLKQSVVK